MMQNRLHQAASQSRTTSRPAVYDPHLSGSDFRESPDPYAAGRQRKAEAGPPKADETNDEESE